MLTCQALGSNFSFQWTLGSTVYTENICIGGVCVVSNTTGLIRDSRLTIGAAKFKAGTTVNVACSVVQELPSFLISTTSTSRGWLNITHHGKVAMAISV